MPYGSDRVVQSFLAGEALTDWQHHIVTLNAAGEVVKSDGAQGEFSIGVLESGNEAGGTIPDGSEVSVCVFGQTKCAASAGSITPGAIMNETDGEFSAVATTKWSFGYLREPSDAESHLCEVFVTGPHYYNTD